jgi:hypothetical protein
MTLLGSYEVEEGDPFCLYEIDVEFGVSSSLVY